MYRKLRYIPDTLGDIEGEDFEADIPVKITTNEKLRADVIKHLNGEDGYEKISTISLDKNYRITKITGYGDVFDVTIINDLGKEETFGEWFFEDID
jgi:hypothetical protein